VVPEAPLEQTEHGLVPAGEGWFVVNARDARWFDGNEFGGLYTSFEGEPCLVLAVGARRPGRGVRFPVSEVALKHSAGVEVETTDSREAYARFSEPKPIPRPPEFSQLTP
jgi:hypothetical protein